MSNPGTSFAGRTRADGRHLLVARTPQQILHLINDSGDPLQLALQEVVESQWPAVRALPELHWHNEARNVEGWLDLLIPHDRKRFLISVKRLLETDWAFLDTEEGATETTEARLYSFGLKRDGIGFWQKVRVSPSSRHGLFMAMPGSRDRQNRLLEAEARMLLAAVEALSQTEERLPQPQWPPYPTRLYIPVIATTARLHSYALARGQVDLATGKAAPGGLQGTSVSVVRMTKAFLVPGDTSEIKSLAQLALEQLRTVFVVEAPHLTEFIRCFDLAY